jgi:hypothetical protein
MPKARGARGRAGLLAALLFLAISNESLAADALTIFGPKTYLRSTGAPADIRDAFEAAHMLPSGTLRIQNGGNGQFDRVTSAVVTVNGQQVLRPGDFGANVGLIQIPITLQPANEISVEVRGKPGSAFILDVFGTSADTVAPSITPAISPLPNGAGWNNTDVVVSFTCADAGSGVAVCPDPVTLTSEGAGQVVTGQATDRAGNTATASVTVNIDKTAPTIVARASPPPNENGWNRTDVIVTFECTGHEGGTACPLPAIVSTEGAAQPVTGSVGDVAGNVAQASVLINLDVTPPTLNAVLSPPPNAAGWNRTDVTIAFEAADALSGVATVSPATTVTTEGTSSVAGIALDRAGNIAQSGAGLNLDKTPPLIAITSPVESAVRRVPRVEVTGIASDSNALASITVEGADVGSTSPFSADVALSSEGPRTLSAVARDVADNTTSASVGVVYSAPPTVRITSPADLSAFGHTPITVSGTVDDPQATVFVGVEKTPAVVTGNTFVAADVPLREGGNVLTAVATDTQGNSGTDSITTVLDTTPPRVFIDSPPADSAVTSATATVAGRVNDIVIGTVNTPQAQVTVNGRPAVVSHRTFIVENVPLEPGSNTLTAVAIDAVGNMDTRAITITRDAAPGPRIEAVSGSGQTAGIGEALADPLVAIVTDGAGAPLAGRSVVFRVSENNGTVSDGTNTAQGLTVTTDEQGQAQARYTLGSRAGVGNNRVKATSPGIAGFAGFSASANAHPPARINLDSGNNQKGSVGQPLPRPFVVVVTDEGHNRLAGAPVTFKVVKGEGTFNGDDSITVTTDTDGRALAVLALGPRPGIENNVVEARVPNLAGLPVGFSASGLEPGDPAQTRISGVVLDNTNIPVPGVTLRIRGTALAATVTDQGQFVLTGVPVGDTHLFVDGSTAQRAGTWPDLEYDLVTVPGVDNKMPMPIYLLPLDTAHGLFVDETTGGTLTLPDLPGFSLKVAANSATFPDGTRHGTITVTAVHADKVPMVPNFGQQPRFIVTIQPPGVKFEPPAEIMHPNVEGLAPGEKTELYSFDHDIGSFVAIGTATVSADGLVLRSDQGTGIVEGGWHCGGNPNGIGTTYVCPTCRKCNGVTCENDDGANCDDQNVCTSADGLHVGADSCMGGACTGATIDFKPITTTLGDVDLPPSLLQAVNAGLQKLPGLSAISFQTIKGSVQGSVEDCCDKSVGVISNGITETSGTISLAVDLDKIPLWGPPVIRKEINVFVATLGLDMEIGLFYQGGGTMSGTGGRRSNLCKGEDCAFGEISAAVSPSIVGTAKLGLCTLPPTLPPIPIGCFTVQPVTISVTASCSVALQYNKPDCGSGLRGKVTVGKVTPKVAFTLPFNTSLLPNVTVAFDVLGVEVELGVSSAGVEVSADVFDGFEQTYP